MPFKFPFRKDRKARAAPASSPSQNEGSERVRVTETPPSEVPQRAGTIGTPPSGLRESPQAVGTPQHGVPRRILPPQNLSRRPAPSSQIISPAILKEACQAVNYEIMQMSCSVIGGSALGVLGSSRGTKDIDILVLDGTRGLVQEDMWYSDLFWVADDFDCQLYLASDGQAYLVNIIEPADIGLSLRYGYCSTATVYNVAIPTPATLLNLKVHAWSRGDRERSKKNHDSSDIRFLLHHMHRRRLQTDPHETDLITPAILSEFIRHEPGTAGIWRAIGLSPSPSRPSSDHSTHRSGDPSLTPRDPLAAGSLLGAGPREPSQHRGSRPSLALASAPELSQSPHKRATTPRPKTRAADQRPAWRY
jgi:hypothetical protein